MHLCWRRKTPGVQRIAARADRSRPRTGFSFSFRCNGCMGIYGLSQIGRGHYSVCADTQPCDCADTTAQTRSRADMQPRSRATAQTRSRAAVQPRNHSRAAVRLHRHAAAQLCSRTNTQARRRAAVAQPRSRAAVRPRKHTAAQPLFILHSKVHCCAYCTAKYIQILGMNLIHSAPGSRKILLASSPLVIFRSLMLVSE